MLTRGILLIAISKPVAITANFTILCLNRHGNNLPIEVITDYPDLILKQENVASVIRSNLDAHFIKTKCIEFSRFHETMVCDVDLFFRKKYSDVWKYLDRGNLCMCIDCHPTAEQCQHISGVEKEYTLKIVPHDSTQYNTGLMLFRKTQDVIDLFNLWNKEWMQYKRLDQLALIRALYHKPTPIVAIPPEYNIIMFSNTHVEESYIGLHDFKFLDRMLCLKL